MKIGIIGHGMVGKALAAGLVKGGHEVMVGTRDLKGKEGDVPEGAKLGTFAQAARFGEALFFAVKGDATDEVFDMAGKENFSGKIVVDVTNRIGMSKDKTPCLVVAYPESGRLIVQRRLPKARIVKAFNMVPSSYMANARLREGQPDLFIAGDDKSAKEWVGKLAEGRGWRVSDYRGIENSYLLEAIAMAGIYYGATRNHWTHAFKLLMT